MRLDELVGAPESPAFSEAEAFQHVSALRPVATEARHALKVEVLPSRPEGMAPSKFVHEMVETLQTACDAKDTWYTRLIRHKAIDQSDRAYFDDLIFVLTEWGQGQEPQPEVKLEPKPEPAADLKRDLEEIFQPAVHDDPWQMTRGLNDLFQRYGVQAKAQVVPALRNVRASRDTPRWLVAVHVGGVQHNLQLFPQLGWAEPLGTVEGSLQALLKRM